MHFQGKERRHKELVVNSIEQPLWMVAKELNQAELIYSVGVFEHRHLKRELTACFEGITIFFCIWLQSMFEFYWEYIFYSIFYSSFSIGAFLYIFSLFILISSKYSNIEKQTTPTFC